MRPEQVGEIVAESVTIALGYEQVSQELGDISAGGLTHEKFNTHEQEAGASCHLNAN